MSNTIRTRYASHPGSNVGDIRATARGARAVVRIDQALPMEANHRAAAEKLAEKLGAAVSAEEPTATDDGYAFAMVDAFRPRGMRRTIGRDLPDGSYVEIEAEERDDSGTMSPGFAITGLGWDPRGNRSGRTRKANGQEADFAGQVHDVILSAAPELAPIVAAHLADQDGTPMHARANGWYFYTGKAAKYERENYGEEYAARAGTDHERAARALHIPADELPEGLDETGFYAFADSLAERWADQAAAARAALAAMVDGDGVEGA